jgi:CubicO group peptidase (beta-lactamase class C family)
MTATLALNAMATPALDASAAPSHDATATPSLAAVAAPAHELTQADADAWLDGFMPYALERNDIAGAEVAIVKDGQVLTLRGFGYSDVAAHKPVDPAVDMFRPGSVSKLFTWTAVMQLVEQGKIDLDVDVNRYLDFKIPTYDGKPITMRNLLTHTPGFEEVARGGFRFENNVPPLGDVLKHWIPKRVFPPGTTPAYSNWGAALAGYIVERIPESRTTPTSNTTFCSPSECPTARSNSHYLPLLRRSWQKDMSSAPARRSPMNSFQCRRQDRPPHRPLTWQSS